MNKLLEVLYANADAIPKTIGGGHNVHIGLLVDKAVYSNIATAAYARPTQPGPYAQHGPGDSVAAQADENVIHKERRRIYDLD